MTKSKMGPKTEEGRMAVAANAVSHGITSASPVIEGESREDWQSHLAGIIESLSPEGDLEGALAERVANLLWRLHRVTRYQTAETLRQIGIVQCEDDPADTYRRKEQRLLLDDRSLDRIMRYETQLHRRCAQALHELEALQARRRGEGTHEARLDISVGPTAYLAAAREL
ncbi:MAG: hypothetical protein J4N98_06725 [Chloroflexi bacterium]|nr:hypothetical protein [Chloroflexota bacterium]MCI0890101.1 hypothetical protein [Chloroflexota bacterium]